MTPAAPPAHPLSPAAGSGVARAVGAEAAGRAAEEFEAVFLAQMLSGLFQGVQGADGGGASGVPGGEAFEGLLHEEYAKLISRSGGIGLADDIRREMLRLQEVTA